MFIFLFWLFSPSLSRHTSRCTTSASRLSDYKRGKIFLRFPANESYGYTQRENSHEIQPSTNLPVQEKTLAGAYRIIWKNNFLYTASAQNFSILDPSAAQAAGVQNPVIVGSCIAPALCLAISGHYAHLGEMVLVPDILAGQYVVRNSMANRSGWIFRFLRGNPDKDDSGPVILSITSTSPGSPGSPDSPGYAQAGALMTLQGKRLSAQSSENWIHFNESQGSFEDTTGWKQQPNCWVRDNWECWAPNAVKRDNDIIFDSQMAILGNQSYRNNIHYTQLEWKYARECPGKGEFYNLTWWDAPNADQYYYRYYVRYSGPLFQWTNISWKQLYVHNLFNLNPCMWDNPPPNRGPARYDIQGQARIFAHLPEAVALERWYCIEIWVKKNGPGVNLKFWLDGEECGIYDEHDQAPQQFPWSKCYQEKNQKLIFGPLELGTTNCQNFTYEQLPVNQSIWFDGFAMSSTRIYPASLVEMGNNSDYAKAKKIRQEILHISDTQIRFRVNTTGLNRGPYYVWVTNNKQERSKAYSLRVKD